MSVTCTLYIESNISMLNKIIYRVFSAFALLRTEYHIYNNSENQSEIVACITFIKIQKIKVSSMYQNLYTFKSNRDIILFTHYYL